MASSILSVRGRIAFMALASSTVLAGCSGGSDAPEPRTGDFVTSFGASGIATLEGGPFAMARASARFAVTDPSGTIRAAGAAGPGSVFSHLLPGGQPDAGFAGTGYLLRPSPPPAGNPPIPVREGLAAIARPDGTEWLVESVDTPCQTGPECSITGGMTRSAVVRAVERTGNSVPGFGYTTPGEVAIPGFHPLQALVRPSGDLLVLGHAASFFSGPGFNRVAHLSLDGVPDVAFETRATSSISCYSVPEPRTRAGAVMARRADGKLLVAQSFQVSSGTGSSRTCVSRLLPDGSPDPTHGTGGDVVLGWEFLWDEMSPVAIFALPNGGSALFLQKRIVDNGRARYFYMIATMTADGALDASRFDRGITGPTDLHVAKLEAVAMQGDGRYLVAGYPAIPEDPPAYLASRTERYDNSQPRIGRILPAGGADLTFGALGTGYAPLISFGRRLGPRHVHIAPDRSIHVAGFAGEAGPVNDNEFTRFAVGKLVGDSAAAQ